MLDLADLTAMMAKVGNSDELLKSWLAWHDTVGPKERNLYIKFVKLANKSAYLGGKYKEVRINVIQVEIYSLMAYLRGPILNRALPAITDAVRTFWLHNHSIT